MHFSLVRFLARSEKEESSRTNFQRKRDPTAERKTRAGASLKNTEMETTTEHFWVKKHQKTCLEAASDGNLAPRAPEIDFGASGAPFGAQNRSQNEPNFDADFRGDFEAPQAPRTCQKPQRRKANRWPHICRLDARRGALKRPPSPATFRRSDVPSLRRSDVPTLRCSDT